jgi:hypothetical protein
LLLANERGDAALVDCAADLFDHGDQVMSCLGLRRNSKSGPPQALDHK